MSLDEQITAYAEIIAGTLLKDLKIDPVPRPLTPLTLKSNTMKQTKIADGTKPAQTEMVTKKTLADLLAIQKKIFEKIGKEPEQAFDFFLDEWMKLTYEEKRTVAAQILRYCFKRVNTDDDHHSMFQPGFEIQQLCCSQIYNEIDDFVNGERKYGHLKLGEGIKPADIAAIFRILYELDYFDNKLVDIEPVIIKVFNLKDNTTISSYFNDSSKLVGARKEFNEQLQAFAKKVGEMYIVNA